jgi:hypothetical protein
VEESEEYRRKAERLEERVEEWEGEFRRLKEEKKELFLVNNSQ